MNKTDIRNNETANAITGDLFAATQAGVSGAAPQGTAELELIARKKKLPSHPKNTDDDQTVSAIQSDDTSADSGAVASSDNLDNSPFATPSQSEHPLQFAEAATGTATDAAAGGAASGEAAGGAASGGAAAAATGGVSTGVMIGGGALLLAAAAGGGGGGGGGGTPPADTTAPIVAITDNTTGTATGPVTYTFTFSEAVTGFTADDITVTNGTKGTFTAIDSTHYTLVVTPTTNSTGNITVDVAAAAATDAASNASTAATQSVQAFNTVVADTTPPTVAITDNVSGTANGPVTYTFTFSEAVTGFTAADVTVTNGTKGTFTTVDSSHYTLVVTPTASATGNITVDVAAGVAADAASNANTAATQSVQAFNTIAPDTTPPTVAITDDEAATGNIAGGNITYTFTFSEAVTGFTAADVTVVNGAKGTFTAIDSTHYTLVVTPTAGFTGNVTVDVPAAGAIDAASNGNTAAAQSVQAVDMLAPTVAITDDEAATGNIAGGNITYTFTFSEAVTGFTAADVTVVNGAKGTFTTIDSTHYTLVVTPTAGFTGNVTVDVPAAGAIDAASNGNTAATQSVQAVDMLAPTASVATATIADTGNATVQSTETGTAYLVNSGVTVNTLADITGAANNQWNQATITTANTGTSLAATGLADGSYHVYTVDAAGNLSAASTNTVTVSAADITPPIATLTAGTLTESTQHAVVQSSEVGTAYLIDSTITVTNLANITGAADNHWNQVAIATANSNTNLDIGGLINGTYTLYTVDAAGNLSAHSANNVTINDTTAPVFASGLTASASIVENIAVQHFTANPDGSGGYDGNYFWVDPRVYNPDADGNIGVTYSIVGGADAGRFTPTALQFDHSANPTIPGGVGVTAPLNFEAPADANGDNVYQFTVRATDANGLHTDQAVSLTVTNDGQLPANEVIDLGTLHLGGLDVNSQLILPVDVGGKLYYFLDANSSGIIEGPDVVSHTDLNSIFTLNAAGTAVGDTTPGATDDTYRYAHLNGAIVALPTEAELIAINAAIGNPAGTPTYMYWSSTPGAPANSFQSVGLGGDYSGNDYPDGVGTNAYILLEYVGPVV
jgi:hypothetical protein